MVSIVNPHISLFSWDEVDRRIRQSANQGGFDAALMTFQRLHYLKTGRPPDGTPEQIWLEVQATIEDGGAEHA